MSVDFHLKDGENGRTAKVNEEGALGVIIHTHPPKTDESPMPFREFFENNGSSDMRVDGSVNEVEFIVRANQNADTYIKSCSVVIADAGASLNNFGNIGALANGMKLDWVTQDIGATIIHDNLVSNFEFIRLSGGAPAFGSGNSSFKANNVVGTSEAFLPVLDFTNIFGIQWGLKLRKGSTDCLRFTVRDDVQGVDQFDAIAYGITV